MEGEACKIVPEMSEEKKKQMEQILQKDLLKEHVLFRCVKCKEMCTLKEVANGKVMKKCCLECLN